MNISTHNKLCIAITILLSFLYSNKVSAQLCPSTGNNTDGYLTGTRQVIFNTINNSTIIEDNDYSDFTGISTNVIQSSSHNLTVNVNTDGSYTVHVFAWIDWNQDNDFLDTGETYDLGTANNVLNGPASACPLSITIPATATLGSTTMRISTKYSSDPSSCENGFDGEVEDYTVIVNSAAPSPEINIVGNSNNITDGDLIPTTADDTDFGNVDVTAGTNPNIFTIQNTGTGPLNLTAASPYVVISGAHAGDFTLTAIPVTPIAASGSTTFTITFNPSALGLRTATLTIANDDSDENPYNFNIQGTGTTTAPEINIIGNATSIVDGDTTPNVADDTDFGNADITSGTAVNTFTIENLGTSLPLNLTGASPYVVVSGTNAADFTVTSIPANSIASGANTTFNITFNPSALGLRTATLTIANNDSNENPYNYDIQGTGVDSCGGYITTFPYTEDFESGIGVWTQDTGDNFDWTNDSAGTPTGSTGPSTANSGTYYMYTEANGNNSNTANLFTPCFDLTGTTNPRLTVFVHMYGANTGTFNLDLSSDSGATYPTNLWTKTAELQNAGISSWTPISIDLSSYIGQTIKIRIQGIVGAGDTSDMAIDSFSITDKSNPTTGPGGVTTDLAIWLKGTGGLSYTDGQSVSLWQDQGSGSDARTQATGQEPTFRDNATKNVNFNPVIEFDNSYATYTEDLDYSHDDTSSQFLTADYGLFTQEMFIVLISDNTPITYNFGFMDAFCGDAQIDTNAADATGIGFGYYTGRISNEIICYAHDSYTESESGDGYAVAEIGTGSSYNNLGIINTRNNSANTQQELYYNANDIETTQNDVAEYMNSSDARYWIGRSEGWEASLNARVAEVISFKSRLNDTDLTQARNRVQSYLAIKYGITLGVNGTSQDYVDSAGNVIWDQSVNSSYSYNIAGIGRDDDSDLNQKQSKSIHETSDGTGLLTGILTMGLTEIYDTNSDNIASNPTNFGDQEFLVWGNDGTSITAPAFTVNVDMSAGITGLTTPVTFDGMQPIWKVVETGGDIPTVEVSIPKNAVRNISPPGSYLMFISDTDIFDPTADYRVMTEDAFGNLKADYNFNGVKYITFGYAPQVIVERSINFDGVQDYIDVENHLDLNTTEFTISSWIKRDTGTTNASILSKRNFTNTEGYDLRIDGSGNLAFTVNGAATTLTSSVVIPENEWHQVAVIYDSGTATIYIDGVEDTSIALPAPIATSQKFLIAAVDGYDPNTTDYFAGNIDEVRIWDIALAPVQLRYIMNQEIIDSSVLPTPTLIKGDIIPTTITKNEISLIPWTDLAGYYPMSVYTYTNTDDMSGNSNQGALRNLNTVDFQTAPLPYESENNGDWTTDATWLNNTVQTLPNTLSIVDGTPIDWNIVETNHNITIDTDAVLGRERSVLGLMVNSGEIQINGITTAGTGNALTVTHYLKLDGSIDLQGESQLIQTDKSVLAVGATGDLERDQQGTADTYTYNYWSSPVGTNNTLSTNNTYTSSFTLPDVLMNGTIPGSPGAINFITSGYNGTSSPFGLADYWIWKFANQTDDDYSAWQHMRSTGNILAGEGYTMKGPGTGSIITDQNYVFNGKPNNGDISLTIGSNNDYLVGNPYPSAIDALKFLSDNPQTNGTLYFWEHWGGGSHILGEYQGGYAQYNYAGGVGAASYGTNDPDVGSGGTATKLPGQYIPVSQGFFVYSPGGGTINFRNDQRIFEKESGGNSTFMRPSTDSNNQPSINYNEDDRMKFRIGFNSVNQIHRQLLLTVDENASSGIDWGFEGKLNEEQMDDMYWMVEDGKYIIQGTNTVNTETIAPLGIHVRDDGMNFITIDHLENVPNDVEIYAFDGELNTYHDLRQSDYQVHLTSGEYLNRFALVFTNQNAALSNSDFELNNAIELFYNNDNESVILQNPNLIKIDSLELFNIIGQSIFHSNEVEAQNYTEIKVSNLSAGTYIINLNTQSGKISKKVLVK